MKVRYIGKEPKMIGGGCRLVTLNKGDVIDTTEAKAKAYCHYPELFEMVKEKSTKEGKE